MRGRCLLLGGRFGAAYVIDTPEPQTSQALAAPPYIRVIVEFESISNSAQTLLLRSLILAGGILAVAALTIRALLDRFVSRPLSAYNTTARRIGMIQGTGRIENVTITALPATTIEVRGTPTAVTGLRISGLKHPIDVWYANGRWVGLDTAAGGGRKLTYRLA